MMDQAVYEYMEKIAEVSDVRKKAEWMMRGCIQFFPFQRASLFTYSPLSHTGEGIFLIENDKMVSLEAVKDDVRPIFPLFQALTRNKPVFINREDILNSFPDKYVRHFELSTLAIVPISLVNIVVGFVLVDSYIGEYPFTKNYLSLLSYYFKRMTVPFFPSFPEKNTLSKRETEVLQHLANGYLMKEMASMMSVSEYTVRDYISSVVRKLGVNHRAEAVAVGMRKGIIL
ncbi:response regulator transcription factor [Peribacillus cavernae]|uniref:Response regulator transcription factor n=1 Tax=Peribacillus cavernae TaxID=1674310 RepID=A0A3S0VR62_9BACI|nr:LuxR C-terminal-related transcriptional regulator [Peribacillus cavernae]MDQ0218831.1 DNA-binding CsgD family transcriptional regulator [Peribacillus cavernae]RUQ31036.1 response regulator transcription factor [Peribacillus cavernae]